MVVILKRQPDQGQVDRLVAWLKSLGLDTHISVGRQQTIIGLVGDTSGVDIELVRSLDVVEDVRRILEPYKNANRKFHQDDTVVDVGGIWIGGGNFQIIAGSGPVESREQVIAIAQSVKASGAALLCGDAFMPYTSPYAIQGLSAEGLKLLREARTVTGLPIVSEIINASHLPLFEDVDMIQVGARNMQNFELLRELGGIRKPILLKRGTANTIKELLMSAEYILAGGNPNVILCERGIRTFETSTRSTLDLSAVPVLHRLTHLPVLVDPGRAAGESYLVKPLSVAAAAVGADGLLIEVHLGTPHGAQSLACEAFDDLVKSVRAVLPFAAGKERFI